MPGFFKDCICGRFHITYTGHYTGHWSGTYEHGLWVFLGVFFAMLDFFGAVGEPTPDRNQTSCVPPLLPKSFSRCRLRLDDPAQNQQVGKVLWYLFREKDAVVQARRERMKRNNPPSEAPAPKSGDVPLSDLVPLIGVTPHSVLSDNLLIAELRASAGGLER
jgi:hypothetical protein